VASESARELSGPANSWALLYHTTPRVISQTRGAGKWFPGLGGGRRKAEVAGSARPSAGNPVLLLKRHYARADLLRATTHRIHLKQLAALISLWLFAVSCRGQQNRCQHECLVTHGIPQWNLARTSCLDRPGSAGRRILINANCFLFGRQRLDHFRHRTEVTQASTINARPGFPAWKRKPDRKWRRTRCRESESHPGLAEPRC
jgi:hypothetical protein